MQVEEIPKSEAELEPIKHLRQSFFTKIDNGLKQKYKSHSPLPPFLLPTPPPPFYGTVSVFPEGHFIMTPPPSILRYFFGTPTPVLIRSPVPPYN